MKRRIVLVAAIVVALVAALVSGGCGCDSSAKKVAVTDLPIIHEDEFGGAYLAMTIDDLNAAGFQYGDSVDVVFSNGYELAGLPYYNGYYTHIGEPLLVAYPGYPYIKVGINNGADLWDIAQLKDDMTASVTLVERGKFADIQNARDISYVDDRSQFPSDEVFANFRSVTVGDIRPGVLYRAASPCDNQHMRATYVSDLIDQAGVKTILDLADNSDKIQDYIIADDFACDYFLTVYKAGNVIPVALNMNFESQEFKDKLVGGLDKLIEEDTPFLVHCTEGKDRTGFVCMLLEALCGASYVEIVDDYMITYDNYYKISKTNDVEKYEVIVADVLDPMIVSVIGDETADPSTADLSTEAEEFLLEAGMSASDIAALRDMLTK